MAYLDGLFMVLQIIAALSVILLVLFQQGKGAEMGAAFGSGASGSLFGATGSANFLSRATAIAITVLIVSSLGYAYVRTHVGGGSVMEGVKTTAPKVDQKNSPEKAAVPAAGTTPSDQQKKTEIPK